MPATLNFVEKLITLKLNKEPAPIIDIVGGFSFYVISAALKLNIFEELGEKSLTLTELSNTIKCNMRGLEIFLEVLESLGYVRKKGQYYENSKMTKKWLMDISEINFKPGFNYYFSTMNELWPYVDESLKSGHPHVNFYELLNKYSDKAKNYQQYMMSLGKMAIPELIKKIKLKNDMVLDIGGSHGLYSIALCQKFKDISVSIIDSQYAMPLLKENINSHGLKDRINLIIGDFANYCFSEKYDVVLLFNVLHEHNAEDNRKLIKNIVNILSDNGCLIILDLLREKKLTDTMDLITRMYGLMFFHFLGGQNYAFNEISEWLKLNGFKRIERKDLKQSGLSMILGYL